MVWWRLIVRRRPLRGATSLHSHSTGEGRRRFDVTITPRLAQRSLRWYGAHLLLARRGELRTLSAHALLLYPNVRGCTCDHLDPPPGGRLLFRLWVNSCHSVVPSRPVVYDSATQPGRTCGPAGVICAVTPRSPRMGPGVCVCVCVCASAVATSCHLAQESTEQRRTRRTLGTPGTRGTRGTQD